MKLSCEFWTEDRQELYDWFKEHSESIAAGYQSAVMMLFGAEAQLPASVHLISHIVRDIIAQLTYAIVGKQRKSIGYQELLKPIATSWELPLLDISSASSKPSGLPKKRDIQESTCIMIDDLVKYYRQRTDKKPRDGTERYPPNPPTKGEKLVIYVLGCNSEDLPQLGGLGKNLEVLRKWFSARAHLKPGSLPSSSLSDLRQKFCEFECYLQRLFVSTRTFESIEELDQILEEANEETS